MLNSCKSFIVDNLAMKRNLYTDKFSKQDQ